MNVTWISNIKRKKRYIYEREESDFLLAVAIFLFTSGCTEDNESMPDDYILRYLTPGLPYSRKVIWLQKLGVSHCPPWEIRYNKASETGNFKKDTVSWWGEKRQSNYLLVSEEKLFPDEKLSYKILFTDTFYERGTYHFIVNDLSEINAIIRVNWNFCFLTLYSVLSLLTIRRKVLILDLAFLTFFF